MKHNKIVYLIFPCLILGGCVGLSHRGFKEREALTQKHSAESKVIRKQVKLGLATAAHLTAKQGVKKAKSELDQAYQEKDQANDHLMKTLFDK